MSKVLPSHLALPVGSVCLGQPVSQNGFSDATSIGGAGQTVRMLDLSQNPLTPLPHSVKLLNFSSHHKMETGDEGRQGHKTPTAVLEND